MRGMYRGRHGQDHHIMYLVWRIFEDAHISNLDMRQALALVQEEKAIDAPHHLARPMIKGHAWASHLQNSLPCLQLHAGHQPLITNPWLCICSASRLKLGIGLQAAYILG